MNLREITREELNRCNGKDGAPVYVAFRGKVYDLSNSFLWQGGRHQVFHTAGADLTGELSQAPHGEDLFARFPVIGRLAAADETG